MFRTRFLAGILLLGMLSSCKKEKEQNPEPVNSFQPTPYKFNIPAWVISNVGPVPEPADNLTTNEGVLLGRKLFYDTRLSGNSSMSCATCHSPSTSFAETATFTIPEGGRVPMAVVNLAWTNKLFWDGRRNSLEEQAHDPVTNPSEMHNTWQVVEQRLQNDAVYPDLFYKAFGTKTIDSILVVKAISQFERTLLSFNSRYDKYVFEGKKYVFSESEKRGYQIFLDQKCNDCHTDVLLTDNSFRNIGLDKIILDAGLGNVSHNSTDAGKFRVPTLRNVALTAPYLHDGRYADLATVIDHYDHGVQFLSPNIDNESKIYKEGKILKLSIQDKQDLLDFLHTFTDSSFITNPAFQNPN